MKPTEVTALREEDPGGSGRSGRSHGGVCVRVDKSTHDIRTEMEWCSWLFRWDFAWCCRAGRVAAIADMIAKEK